VDSKCSDRCLANSADYHYRDSIEYLVYGVQAWVKACLYLKPFTKFNYKNELNNIMKFLDPYIKGTKTHIEYINSNIASDVKKPSYNKPFQPKYCDTMLRLYNQL
jgi:hypothetical protein